MSARSSRAPSSAKRMAMASPIPAPTPVTMARLSFNRMRMGSVLGDRSRRQFPAGDDTVDHAVLPRLLGPHDVVAIHIARHAVDGLSRRLGEQLVQRLAHPQDLPRINIDLGSLSRQALHRTLVD